MSSPRKTFANFLDEILLLPASEDGTNLKAICFAASRSLKTTEADLLHLLQEMKESGFRLSISMKHMLKALALTVKNSVPWRSSSQEQFNKVIGDALDGLVMCVPTSHLKDVKNWLTPPKDGPTKRKALSPSSGTQKDPMFDISDDEMEEKSPATQTTLTPSSKKRKLDMRMSTTAAGRITTTADVDSSKDSDVSLDEDDELLMDVKSKDTKSGTGCSISLVRQGDLYVFKSEKTPTRKRLIKFEIYEDPRAFFRADSKSRWKLASFRGTMLLGDPKIKDDAKDPSMNAINRMRHHLLQEAKKFPSVDSYRIDNYKTE